MLAAKGVSVRVGRHLLLDNFTAQFAPGELVMVVGPNGAGKTTLLRCLNGELTPTRGGVELARRPIGRWPRDELARRRAVLPQHSTLDFPFSVRDVVLMGRLPHTPRAPRALHSPHAEAEDHAIAARVLELCDCAQLGERLYPSLSGGEQQRVQTARVLAQIWDSRTCPQPSSQTSAQPSAQDSEERFLLLDEPASALDLSHQYALLRLLKRLGGGGKIGVVCTLHNLNLVAQFADRAVIMDKGMLVADGAPLDVFTEETLSHVFDLEVAVRRHPDDASIPLLIPRLSPNNRRGGRRGRGGAGGDY